MLATECSKPATSDHVVAEQPAGLYLSIGPNVDTTLQPAAEKKLGEDGAAENDERRALSTGCTSAATVGDGTGRPWDLSLKSAARTAVSVVAQVSQHTLSQAGDEQSDCVTPQDSKIPTPASGDWLKTGDMFTQQGEDILLTLIPTGRKCPHSYSSPPRSPFPNDGLSSTLVNTSRRSSALPSPALTNFLRAIDQHRLMSEKLHQAQIDHLEAEAKVANDDEWAAIVAWREIAHQAEIADLKYQVFVAETTTQSRENELDDQKEDYEAEVEALKEERDDALRRAASANYKLEIKDTKIKSLQSSAKEASKEKKALQSQLKSQSLEASTLQAKIDELQQEKSDIRQALDEAQKLIKHFTPTANNLEAEYNELEAKCDSQATQIGELEAMNTQLRMNAPHFNDYKTEKKVQELEQRNKQLIKSLEFVRGQLTVEGEETAKVRAELKGAGIEVGLCHLLNAGYRNELEDANPSRTAHLDGHLKRKDEVIRELDGKIADYAAQLAEEKKLRAAAEAYSSAKIRGLEQELAYRSNVVDALTSSRDSFAQQKDQVFEMLKGRIFHDDVVKALCEDHESIRKDDAFLISLLQSRECRIAEAAQDAANVRAEKVTLEHDAETTKRKQQAMQAEINGLYAHQARLKWIVEVQPGILQKANDNLAKKNEEQAQRIETIFREGPFSVLLQDIGAKEHEISRLCAEINRLNGIAHQLQMRIKESGPNFCHWYDGGMVDWSAEESRLRLKVAERTVLELKEQLTKLIGEDKVLDMLKPEDERSQWLNERVEALKERKKWSKVE